ncbi:hypothetical protein DL98DRAFT_596686 [Cadophora sp. DSE1049]|nr:hypothetical protein DL98DRAFT_596686 [Cadophora sp. DSE1049]
MDPTDERIVDASAAAALEKLARDFRPDVASCSSDTSEFSDDEVESASDIDENTPLAHLRVPSIPFGRETEMCGENCSCQNHTILELRLSMINDIMKRMKHLQKALQEEKVCRYQEDLISADSQIKQLSKENQRLHGKIQVLEMVMARYESRNEALISEKCDLQGKLEALANASVGNTEPDTTTGSHKRDRGSQVAKHSDIGDRARKRAKRSTASP